MKRIITSGFSVERSEHSEQAREGVKPDGTIKLR